MTRGNQISLHRKLRSINRLEKKLDISAKTLRHSTSVSILLARMFRASSRYLALFTLCALALSGCESGKQLKATPVSVNPSQDQCDNLKPRIHTIGTQSILTFERKSSERETQSRRIYIPVEGRDLIDEKCLIIAVDISGTVPAVPNQDYEFGQLPPQKDLSRPLDAISIVLKEPYLDRLKTGDQLTVLVMLSRIAGTVPAEARTVTYATRKFTIYEVNDYREQVLERRVPTHDIRAFPLPEDEISKLFGPLVADNFFVVRLSLRNTQDTDKLVSTGMIVASGRAVVEPLDEKTDGKPQTSPISFTVPVEVVPQSATQMYTILDDRGPLQTRSIVLRTLEFVGALATAATAGFTGSTTVSKAVGLFTGVAIPETRKWWTDPWPAYKRNIVAYAMPDLVKIPRNSVSGHKYIFFSKNKIETLITDHLMFGPFEGPSLLQKTFGALWDRPKPLRPTHPNIAIISLAFDNFDIPFEAISGPPQVVARPSEFKVDVQPSLEEKESKGEESKGKKPK